MAMAGIARPAGKDNAQGRPVLFTGLPTQALLHPPIRTNPPQGYLTPLEFAVMCGLLNAARAATAQKHHEIAMRAGAKEIERERRRDEEFRAQWAETQKARQRGERAKAPTRRQHGEDTHTPEPLATSLRKAGGGAYARTMKRQRLRGAPDEIEIEVSRYKLLRHAGLDNGGANRRRLDAALNRLQHPILLGEEEWPGPLFPLQTQPDGPLKLLVRGLWLPARIFGRLPMPLPLKSAPALALYCFLNVIRSGPANRQGAAADNILHRLGISGAKPKRALFRAMDVVNDHLAALDAAPLERLDRPIELPGHFRIEEDSPGYIRFVRRPRRVRVEPEEEFYVDTTPDDGLDPETSHKRKQRLKLEKAQAQVAESAAQGAAREARQKERAEQQALLDRLGHLTEDDVRLLEAGREYRDAIERGEDPAALRRIRVRP